MRRGFITGTIVQAGARIVAAVLLTATLVMALVIAPATRATAAPAAPRDAALAPRTASEPVSGLVGTIN